MVSLSSSGQVEKKTKNFMMRKVVLYVAAGVIFLAIIAAVVAIFLVSGTCSIKLIETDRNVEYTLSYCGDSGDYCEEILD